MGPEPFLSLLMWSWPGEESGLVPVPQQPLPREIFINCGQELCPLARGGLLRDRRGPQGSRRGPGLGPLSPSASLGLFHTTGLRGNASDFILAENEGERREVPQKRGLQCCFCQSHSSAWQVRVSPQADLALCAQPVLWGALGRNLGREERLLCQKDIFKALCVPGPPHTGHFLQGHPLQLSLSACPPTSLWYQGETSTQPKQVHEKSIELLR